MADPANSPIAQSTRDLTDKLLLERLSLAAIVRVTSVSKRWLQSYVDQKYSDRQLPSSGSCAAKIVSLY